MILRGTVYIDGELKQRYIGTKDGKIDFVERSYPEDDDVFEYDGVILPAGVDMHVHFRDPGMTEKEDFSTGSKSAACGGITTVMDMPNTEPPTDTQERLKDKIELAQRKSYIDFGLYGLVSENAEDMLALTDMFKVYMASSTNIDSVLSGDRLENILEAGGKVAFHCEDEDMFKEPGEDLRGHNRCRPPKSEVSAIKRLHDLPEGKKHICHVSTKEGVMAAKEIDCTTEVTPHHLFLNQDAFVGTFGKVNPPLRADDDQLFLWESFERDEIDVLASDHAPHLEEEKTKDFKEVPAGIPGVETMYPLLMNSVSLGNISLSTVVKTIAENPADIIDVKKGRIQEGYDADFALFDFRETEKIDNDRLHSRAGWSPFDGFRAVFPRHVISKGEFVVKDREFVGEKGRGEYISKR